MLLFFIILYYINIYWGSSIEMDKIINLIIIL